MSDRHLYDSIGTNYDPHRRPDARIEKAIRGALGPVGSVLNVGAGAGSYEPGDLDVQAVELSMTMIRQRPATACPAVQANSARLPYASGSFDATLAILTIHHWEDMAAGLAELRRVARRRVVILTWDPAAPGFWIDDYFPEILEIDQRIFPSMSDLERALGAITVTELPIPHDCTDGFLGAYWRRPAAYLDAGARGAISTFRKLDDVDVRIEQLEQDLATGHWTQRYGSLLSLPSLDLGYRLVVADVDGADEERVA